MKGSPNRGAGRQRRSERFLFKVRDLDDSSSKQGRKSYISQSGRPTWEPLQEKGLVVVRQALFLNHGMNAVRRPQVAGRRDPAYRKKHTTIGRVRRGRLGKAARREI